MNKTTSTAFENLSRIVGTFNACSELNERIAERMKEEHPEYCTLEPLEREILWQEYCDRFTGAAADELLPEYKISEP